MGTPEADTTDTATGPQLACDYSFARPEPAAIKAAGYVAVVRYFSGGTGKDLTASEAAALLAEGLGVGVVWETTAQRALAGANAGSTDGATWVAQAHRVGIPAGCVAWTNVGDWAVAPSQAPAVVAYYKAFAEQVSSAGYQPGGYGPRWVIDYLVNNGCSGWWWQNAIDDNGEAGDVVDSRAALYQRTQPTRTIAGARPGVDYDEDPILNPGVPWWTSSKPAPPTPGPVLQPTPIPGENMQQLVVNMPIGDNGEGEMIFDGGTHTLTGIESASPAIPYGNFIAATAYGPCVPAGDADWGPIHIDQQLSLIHI